MHIWHHSTTVSQGQALLDEAVNQLLVGSIVCCRPEVGSRKHLALTDSDLALKELPPSWSCIRANMPEVLHDVPGIRTITYSAAMSRQSMFLQEHLWQLALKQ